jgi:acetyl-CoA acyltransferase
MSRAVIAGYARTPFHFARKGKLAAVRPDDLAAIALRGLVTRLGLEPALVDDVLMGCAYPEGEQGTNVARIATLLAGFPDTVAGATINRFCGSSMTAVHYAAGQIAIGAGEAFICAGVESMTRVPQGGFSFSPNPRFRGPNTPVAEFPIETYVSMGQTAENVADRYGISRIDQETFALASQQKAAAAVAGGRLSAELVPVEIPDGIVDADGCPRPLTTLAGLAQLKPAFGGTVTAGTASPLTDGAAAVLICSEPFAHRHHLDILARIRTAAVAGCAPEIMGMGPVPATRKALARAGLTMGDIDVVELNEAFASQAVACMRELGISLERTNIDGGAIALGHPLGATGARITGKAAQILRREGKRYALATQCIGGGQGIATVLEAA